MSGNAPFVPSLPPEVQQQALAEAERFYGAGPIAAWQPAPRWSWPGTSSRALKAALAVTLALAALAAAGVAAMHWGWPTADAQSAFDLRAALASTGTDDTGSIGGADDPHDTHDTNDDVIDEPPPVSRPAPAPLATGAPLLNITRIGREWRIEAVGISRLAAAQRLGQVSGSPLQGDVAALGSTRPLDLQWQGRHLADAWRALLGHEVNFATHCVAARCRVWILDAAAGHTGPAWVAAAPRPAIPLPTSVDLALAPPASDSTDPRIAAHHD